MAKGDERAPIRHIGDETTNTEDGRGLYSNMTHPCIRPSRLY